MSDSANPYDPVPAHEPVRRELRSARRWLRVLGLLLVIALGSVIWLVRRAEDHQKQSEREHRFWVVGHAASTPQERTEAFLGLVAAGNREWRGAHLDGLKFEGLNLARADLGEADLKHTSFVGATLTKASFAKARLELADFAEADLSGADLSGALMLRASLKRTRLDQANLRGAVLEQAEAQVATLLLADLAGAYLLMANLSGAKLGGADLSGANLEAATLSGADLSLTRMNNTNLKDADFTDCNWWRARGLSALQIELLEQKFIPTEKWPASLREDYQEWCRRREGDSGNKQVISRSR